MYSLIIGAVIVWLIYSFCPSSLEVGTVLKCTVGWGNLMKLKCIGVIAIGAISLTACATPPTATKMVAAPVVPNAVREAAMQPIAPSLKRKIAIGRFSNSTNYGRALLMDGQTDPLAEQASDMLMTRLIDTGQFLVFERADLDVVKNEAAITGNTAQLVGVDALIVGSVTQFGRETEGQVGFLSSTKRQSASATVEIRLVDARTGLAFFSTSGSGTASVEAGEVAGFGSRAAYDSTLNDRAIAAAISDVTTNIVQKLQERPWTTDILAVSGSQVQISGGPHQGIKIGDTYIVESKGKTVVSGQSGLPITLPGTEVARIRVTSFFGAGDSEGSTAEIVSGTVPATQRASLIVREAQ
jgi:curli biogenesis system outer membrane secretion channel CsgG